MRKGAHARERLMRALLLALALAASTSAPNEAALKAGTAPAGTVDAVITKLNLKVDDATEVVFASATPAHDGHHHIGIYARCEHATRDVEAGACFGLYPEWRTVQTRIEHPGGIDVIFGPQVRGTARSGFHSPQFRHDAALRFVDCARGTHHQLHIDIDTIAPITRTDHDDWHTQFARLGTTLRRRIHDPRSRQRTFADEAHLEHMCADVEWEG